MEDIVSRNLLIEREVWERDEAKRVFAEIGEKYKVEIIEDIIPEGEEVSVYRQGDWFDVCRGPFAEHQGNCRRPVKLMKLAGACGVGILTTRCCNAFMEQRGETRRN